jgi:hypothetical protein
VKTVLEKESRFATQLLLKVACLATSLLEGAAYVGPTPSILKLLLTFLVCLIIHFIHFLKKCHIFCHDLFYHEIKLNNNL